LVAQLIDRYPGLIIPPLPEKNPLAKINKEDSEFQEGRKRGLLYFIEKTLKHPDIRFTQEFISFLKYNDIVSCSSIE
jgi:PX domain